ncbi:hypothetical protein AB0M05_02385 [Streptomyces violaceusniger]|uniref:hypothetical protein n=1 Tax=Streptomyces violaceusniger TaxID=68280 RepID=UPI00341DFB02
MVFPSEHITESTRPLVADRVTREMREVARRRGWASAAPAEPSAGGTPYVLFCGALPDDLARRQQPPWLSPTPTGE